MPNKLIPTSEVDAHIRAMIRDIRKKYGPRWPFAGRAVAIKVRRRERP